MPPGPPPAQHEPVQRANRLASQSSPYLLQHRFNPVDWYPWGPEAFAEARRRDVPIFLSIGYSTCYWCHVMERESFENEAIAAIMNKGFVCIKVDREERPDVDDIYMAAVQAFSGHGGWPMSVFLEPKSLKPFWAGTYFPAEPKFSNVPTFPQVLAGLSGAWSTDRKGVLEQADHLGEAVRERAVAATQPVAIDESQITGAVTQLLRLHDRVNGGFGSAPKFPQPVYLELLLSARAAAGDDGTRDAIDAVVRNTLDHMALGGMFDQVGGGFHRYSVDAVWLVPHFEKMLYDNAQLAALYGAAGELYDDAFYRRIARRTGEYVLREMVSPAGGFYSAQDAEANHREGQNYLWTPHEVCEVLDADDAELAIKVYRIAPEGNFKDPHHPDEAARSVLSLSGRPSEIARELNLSEDALLRRLDAINAALLAARAKRDQPGTDTKILAGWNGLMIAALARCGRVLGEPAFTSAARKAADFILVSMRDADGGLLRSWSAGRAQIPGFLEDYAMVAQGLLALHSAGADPDGRYLAGAQQFLKLGDARFGEPSTGAYYDALADQSDLFIRPRSIYDGAVPSGTSMMLRALIALGEQSKDRAFIGRAARGLSACSEFISTSPLGAANSCCALLRLLSIDRQALTEALRGASSPAKAAELPDDYTPVEILAPSDRVEIAPEHPGGLVLKVRIAEGYHLTAAIPGSSDAARDLVPFKVHIINGTGVSIFADYPKGEALGEMDQQVMIYKGEFDLPIVIEREGQWQGRPLIAITYQPCTDTACLKPRTVELNVAIDRK